jgi:hypothetical protein
MLRVSTVRRPALGSGQNTFKKIFGTEFLSAGLASFIFSTEFPLLARKTRCRFSWYEDFGHSRRPSDLTSIRFQ